jgi:hypothetical protein
MYREIEKARVTQLIQKTDIFSGGTGGGMFDGKEYDFILADGKHNLFPPVLDDVLRYFAENKIAWWRGNEPTGHVLSSQIACLNHLFYLRRDKDAVMRLLSSFSNDFIDVLAIETDQEPHGYIQFEAVSAGDNLREGIPRRGANNTSIDALIYAKHKNGEKWIIVIEWKYTEAYGNEDKSSGKSGAIRLERYSGLINASRQVKPAYQQWCFYEPFYQLMRQTLWAEQMIQKKAHEKIKADNYTHIHIIPNENKDLLAKEYPCSKMNMENTWRACIADQTKYTILSPRKFLSNVSGTKYTRLKEYLSIRYWTEA